MRNKVTGKILPMHNSPHISQVQKWLSENPNYRPVKPGTKLAESIKAKRRKNSVPGRADGGRGDGAGCGAENEQLNVPTNHTEMLSTTSKSETKPMEVDNDGNCLI